MSYNGGLRELRLFGPAKSRRLRGRSGSLKRSYKDDAAYFFDNTARDDGQTAT